MNKQLFTLIILICSLTSICGQLKATTEDGKNVILNENGSWEFVKSEILTSEQPLKPSDCGAFISTEIDKVTGKSTTASKETLIISSDGGRTGFGILMLNISGTVVLSIQAAGGGSCIDDDDKMNILFRDGTRIELINNGKFNCEGKFTLYLGGKLGGKKELESFKSKEIEIMRIWTSKSYVEMDFNVSQSRQFLQTVSCLSVL